MKPHDKTDRERLLKEQSEVLGTVLIPQAQAQIMIPHIAIKQLYESRRVRGIKLHNKWYYAELDLQRIASEERYYIKRINKLLDDNRRKVRIKLYKIISKIEAVRGQIALLDKARSLPGIVRLLDAVIVDAHKFRDDL